MPLPKGHVLRRIVCLLLLAGIQLFSGHGLGLAQMADSAGANFSPLDAINPDSVGRLALAFSFRIEQRGGFTGAPAVSNDTLFLQSPFPHTVYALNLMRHEAPVVWRFTPEANHQASAIACCDATTGGPVVAGADVFIDTLDGHTLALDAATGRVRWDVTSASPDSGEALTAAPMLADGKVFIGSAGDDFGARGWIAALDAATGATVWKHDTTGPDADVGIGPDFKPPYATEQGRDLGSTTWPPGTWQQGGGGLAGGIVYDPVLGLVLHGTGHPAPWNPDQRPGDNKWTSGLFARDAATGAARWFDPVMPHDLYAFGAQGSLILADMPWRGSARKLLIHPDASGWVYVLDRLTGEMLSAAAFVPGNATTGIDLATGALRRNAAKSVSPNSITRDICPGWPGATGAGAPGAAAAAFSPETGLLYIPVSRLCMDFEPRDANFISGTPFIGANLRMRAAPGLTRGAVVAWNVADGKVAWTVDEAFPVTSGVLATGGGVVFYGTLDGQFKATEARTGRPLWQFKTASGIIGQPITFRLSDGHQYVAVVAGVGGAAGRAAQQGIDVRDATAAHGYANVLRDLKPADDPAGTLYVFALL